MPLKAIALLLLATLLFFQDLGSVRVIHVGEMGHSDYADRFRILLEEQLSRRGFRTVDNPERADATLTGIIIIEPNSDGSSLETTTIVLKGRDGRRLWNKDYRLRRPFSRVIHVDAINFRAQVVAGDIKRAYSKSP